MNDRFKRIEHMLNGVRCGTIGTITATEKIIEMFGSDGGYAVLADVLAEFQKHGNTSPERFEMTWDTLEQILSKYFS